MKHDDMVAQRDFLAIEASKLLRVIDRYNGEVPAGVKTSATRLRKKISAWLPEEA
jgi:hypothetical protein